MVLVTDVWPSRRLLRPFLGTGLLGGYTTFSTYIVDIQHLLEASAARTALAYLAGTVLAALAATYLGVSAVGTGLCGALTTYSTFGYETVRLLQERARLFAALNVAGSIVAGLGAAAALALTT